MRIHHGTNHSHWRSVRRRIRLTLTAYLLIMCMLQCARVHVVVTPALLHDRTTPPMAESDDHIMCGDARADGEERLVEITMDTSCMLCCRRQARGMVGE